MEIYKALYNPFRVVRRFEEEVCRYTGAPYAIAVDSCTNALFLACKYFDAKTVEIPSKTYLSVPMAIINAGGDVIFDENRNDWRGIYDLCPFPIYDSAKRFTSEMYISGSVMCLSFHNKKLLAIGKGGMILTDDIKIYDWMREMRYEGRSEKDYHMDDIKAVGYNMYMSPEQAVRGLMILSNMPIHNPDQEEENGYKDLRELSVFKDCEYIAKR